MSTNNHFELAVGTSLCPTDVVESEPSGICSFDIATEIRLGRYTFSKECGFGKLDRLYTEHVRGSDGHPAVRRTFPGFSAPLIDHSFPYGVFVPTAKDFIALNESLLGEGWRDDPEPLLQIYDISRKLVTDGDVVYIVLNSLYPVKCRPDDGRAFLTIGDSWVDFHAMSDAQEGFIPVFFTDAFRKAAVLGQPSCAS
ncbi:hypothetical protein IJH27_00810 [Candidatus Saccharibacteria bacterium]|nr:hypothetical protein [Candidatus Saccharibacteria bacterium]